MRRVKLNLERVAAGTTKLHFMKRDHLMAKRFKRKGGDQQPRPSIWSLLPERLRLALPRTGWALVSIGLPSENS
jgi:hypothetical protein